MGGSWKEHPDENHNIALCIEENTLNEQGQNMFGLGLCRKEHKWPRTLTYLRQEACRQPSRRGSPSNRTTRLPSDFLPWTVSLIREAEGWGRKMTRLRELVFHCLACVRACVRAWKSVGSQSPTSWTFYEADALCNLGGQVCFSAPPPPGSPCLWPLPWIFWCLHTCGIGKYFTGWFQIWANSGSMVETANNHNSISEGVGKARMQLTSPSLIESEVKTS